MENFLFRKAVKGRISLCFKENLREEGCIAVFLGLKFKEAVLPVVLGNLIAGLLISALAQLCLAVFTIEVLDYILYALFALAVIFFIILIVKVCKQKVPTENSDANDKEI